MGLVIHSFANGWDESPVATEGYSAPIKSIGNSTTTPRDLENDLDVQIIFMALAESVSARLRKHGFKCNTVAISIRDNSLYHFSRQMHLREYRLYGRCMLRYIRNTGKCSMEMIVDEMLAILNDRDAYVQKQIEKNRRIDLDDLFIRGFDIRWNEELQDSYVYQIPAIANIDHFEFKSNITFFVGENGSGKSTLLEAFAVACGLNPEGGTANYRFSTYDDYSDLASAIKLRKGVSKPNGGISFGQRVSIMSHLL